MKRISFIQLSLVVLIFCSCDLSMQPISEIDDGAFYNNTSELNAAVVSCYNGLQSPLRYEWMLTELRSDNARLHTSATTSSDRTMQLDFDQSLLPASISIITGKQYIIISPVATLCSCTPLSLKMLI